MSAAGNITKRGRASWRLKFEGARDPETGRRNIQYETVRGTKAEAKTRLAELVASVGNSSYIEPSKLTVAEHVRARVDQWEAAYDPATKTGISGLTAEGYRELVGTHIVPHLGTKLIQKLTTLEIEGWHTALRRKVGARTIERAHRVLSSALKDGVRHGLLPKNVAAIQGAPKVDAGEVQVVKKERLGELVDALRGRAMYAEAITSLFTGLRRNEVLALRWGVHADLDAKVIRVREALEQTKANGLRVKVPKTTAGKRDVSLPEIVVDALRDHRRQQLEQRMALGLGRPGDDALVFPDPLADPLVDSSYQAPRAFSQRWARLAASIGMPEVTFHALRHTHASQLIDAGIDIVMISKRLGHAKPDITLRIYAHLFSSDDSKASSAINDALAGLAGAR